MNPREKAYELYREAFKIHSYLTHYQAKEFSKLTVKTILEALKYPDITHDLSSDMNFWNETLNEIDLI